MLILVWLAAAALWLYNGMDRRCGRDMSWDTPKTSRPNQTEPGGLFDCDLTFNTHFRIALGILYMLCRSAVWVS